MKTATDAAPPVPEDVLEAIAALPDARREALMDWLRGSLARMNGSKPRSRIRKRQPSPATFGWLGNVTVDDFGGEAA